MDRVQVIREAWEAVERGNLDAIEAVLAPNAKWRGVEDGPWNREGRSMILDALTRDVLDGYSMHLEDVFERNERVIVAIRPDANKKSTWAARGWNQILGRDGGRWRDHGDKDMR